MSSRQGSSIIPSAVDHSVEWHEAARNRPLIIQIVIIIALSVALTLAIPVSTKALVDNGILAADERFIVVILLAQLCIQLGLVLLRFARNQLANHSAASLGLAMTSTYVDRLCMMPFAQFDRFERGHTLERFRDYERLQRFWSTDVSEFLASGITIVALALLLLWANWEAFLVFLGSSVVYACWLALFIGIRRKQDQLRFALEARARSHEVELVSSMQDLKIASWEERTGFLWRRGQTGLANARLSSETTEQRQLAGAQVISRTSVVVINLVVALGVINEEVSLGVLFVVTSISIQLYFHVDQLIDFSRKFHDASLSRKRVAEVADLESEDAPGHRPVNLVRGPVGISFRDVEFSYPGNSSGSVLAGVSFDVPAGASFAIVGPSGSGKSTMLKLLLKLYEPSAGHIEVGGHKLSLASGPDWRRNCGVVTQDGILFRDTIGRNIVGDLPFDWKRLNEAAELACCREYIEQFHDGFSAVIGEEGVSPSPGQRQRLLLARTFYKRPKIVIFDEPTSALDPANEETVLRNVNDVLADSTRVVVTHRISTVQGSDMILVLDRGKVAQIGAHDSLIEQGGVYSELVAQRG